MTVSTPIAPMDAILGALDPEQRAAATLPDGPAQIIAPAGSGKTTTMVARLAVLLGRGVPAGRICVVTFNRDAAADLRSRVERRLVPHVPEASSIEIRTLHALARQVLLDVGEGGALVADRLPLLRAARRRVMAAAEPRAEPPDAAILDGWLSTWKIEGREPPATGRAVLDAYADLLAGRGAIDFDDLVVRAAALLQHDPRVRLRWQSRFAHVCVDEFQDVDAAQLRLVRLLAAPEDNLFVVGDDDQTIYAWRLADVRRILDFGSLFPSARRVTLATNYRCPPEVVAASARVIARNQERFEKAIRSPAVGGRPDVIGAWDTADPGAADGMARFAAVETARGRTCCFLARTRAELTPILLALCRAGVRHATAVAPLVEAQPVVTLIDLARARPEPIHPFHLIRRLRVVRGWDRSQPSADLLSDEEHAAIDALLGWAAGFATTESFVAAYDAARARLAALRDPQAPVELATAHGAKGREWETVVLIGFEEDRMPNRRALVDADDPLRAFEEERRLAYVALTRATRRLLLAFDPRRPSPFLAEMGLAASA
jgi:DNA helicase-2/ATP-dependent DNA helicase PcrA